MQNDMRDRLIELLCEGTLKTEICTSDTHMECESCRGDCGYCTILADYLIANGVIAPKVKAGQTVWFPSEYYDGPYPIVITHLEIYEEEIRLYSYGGSEWIDTDIGKTVFLTREEAEKALKEKQNESNT